MNKKVLSLWIVAMFLISLGAVPALQGEYVRAQNVELEKILLNTWVSDVVTSYSVLPNRKAIFVTPEYTAIPDYAVWYLISESGDTISGYSDYSLPYHSSIYFIYYDPTTRRIFGVARPDTSWSPPGGMAILEYNMSSNQWNTLFTYKGDYYRLDPNSMVVSSGNFIVAGMLMNKSSSNRIPFVASFSSDGKLHWIRMLEVQSGQGYARVLKRGGEIYIFVAGTSQNSPPKFEGLFSLQPDGTTHLIREANSTLTPFMIRNRDLSTEDESTLGLYTPNGNDIYVWNFNDDGWTHYVTAHKIITGPFEESYYHGKFLIAYWSDNREIYLTDLSGDIKLYTSNDPYTGLITLGVSSNYLFLGYYAAYGRGRVITFEYTPLAKPVADFTFTPETPKVNEIITFNASPSYDSDGSIVDYTWDFGDGTTGEGKIVTHSYSQPGTYTVTLTVEDDDGLTANISKNITVVSPTNAIKLVVGNVPVAFVDVEVWKDGQLIETATSNLEGNVYFAHEIDQTYTLKILGEEYEVSDMIKLRSGKLTEIDFYFYNTTLTPIDKVWIEIERVSDGKRFQGMANITLISTAPKVNWKYFPKDTLFKLRISDSNFPNIETLFSTDWRIGKNSGFSAGVYYKSITLHIYLPYLRDHVDEAYFTEFNPFMDGYSFGNPSINAHVDWADTIRQLLNLPTEGLCYGMSTTAGFYYNYKVRNSYPKLILYQQDSFDSDNLPLVLYDAPNAGLGEPVPEYGIFYYDNLLFSILLHQEYQNYKTILTIGEPIPPDYAVIYHEDILSTISSVISEDISSALSENTPLLISVGHYPALEHAVLTFGYIKSGDIYYFAVYDPNWPLEYRWLIVNGTNIKLDDYNFAVFSLPESFKYSWFLSLWEGLLQKNPPYKRIKNYFENYTLLVSPHQLHLTYTNSTGTYNGEFVDGRFYQSTIPYSAGFMEWSKENGKAEPFYAVIYPTKLNELGKVEIKPLTPPGDLDPYTVMAIGEDQITGFSINASIDVTTQDVGDGYILKANGSGEVEVTTFTITNVSYENTTLTFQGTNVTIQLNDTTVQVDLNGDGVIDETISSPDAEFTFAPNTTGVNSPITFNASLSYDPDGSIVRYVWDFGDGTAAEGEVVTHSYLQSGIYTVTLTVIDEDGVATSVSKIITIQPIITFIPPTPEDNAVINQTYVFINVTSNEPLETALLEWNGKNITMKNTSPTNWYINMTNLKSGTYTFKVWGKDENDNWGVSETRTITINLPEQITPTTTYASLLGISQLWTTWFFKYYDEFNKLYQNATAIGIDNETLQKALELHNNATELIKEAWHTDNLDDIKAKLWKEVKIIPKIMDIRRAFLKEKKAVEILREAIEKVSSS